MFTPQLPTHQLLSHAVSLHRAGRLPQAVEVYRQLLRQFPNNPEILARLGSALTTMGQTQEGRRHLERAIRLAPDQAGLHYDLHLNYKREGKLKDAHASLDKALKLAPVQPAFLAARAELHLLTGDVDKAWSVIRPVVGQAADSPSLALIFAALARHVGREDEAMTALRAILARQDVVPSQRIRAQFALAHLLDLKEDVDAAFEAYQAANQLRNASWDSERHRQAVDAAIAAWTPEVIASLPRAEVDGSKYVFIVGMPRSGEWIVERAINALPGTQVLGEVPDLALLAAEFQGEIHAGLPVLSKLDGFNQESVNNAANRYFERGRRLKPDAVRFIDRNPLNFANIGLLSRIVPGARVISCAQDPADACLACWFTHFSGNLNFAYDLATLGRFSRDHRRLMEHWKQVVDVPILELEYEDLVLRHDETARRIASFVDLPWSDAALSPTGKDDEADDRSMKAMARAIGRAQRYQKHLEPLFQALNES